MQMRFSLKLTVLAALLTAPVLGATDSFAHAVKLFAVNTGNTVNGYAYFSGGQRIAGAPVTIYNHDNNVEAQVITAPDGTFSHTPQTQGSYRIELLTGDGHRAEFTVSASSGFSPQAPESHIHGNTSSVTGVTAQTTPHTTETAAPLDTIRSIINESLATHITPLREELNVYRDEVRLSDIIGGVGYILGLAGLASLVLKHRK